MAHTFNPSPLGAKAGGLSLRPVWNAQQDVCLNKQESLNIHKSLDNKLAINHQQPY